MRERWILPALAALVLTLFSPVASPQGTAEGPPVTIPRTFQAIAYPVSGSVNVNLKPTGVVAGAGGSAKVAAKSGGTNVEVRLEGLRPPIRLGAGLLAYVLWAVSSGGKAVNLGAISYRENGEGKLTATTQLQSFAILVTAEPYSEVRRPGEVVILEDAALPGETVLAVRDYPLTARSQYQAPGNPALPLDLKRVPFEIYEARNAVAIAKARGAADYSPTAFSKAQAFLKQAEIALDHNAGHKEIADAATRAEQFAEDARTLASQRQEEERITALRAAAEVRARQEAEAKLAAETAEARRKEAQRQQEITAARTAQARAETQAREARAQAEAEVSAARAQAEADILRAKDDAVKADAAKARTAAVELRTRLLDQFNRIVESSDTPRGLVLTFADVLFEPGKSALRTAARENLARFSGILLAHTGLTVRVEGYTDSAGGEQLNQKLSQQRAEAVRDFLIRQGLDESAVTAAGFGAAMPVADNDTPAGRKKNRRVELIVSGDAIGSGPEK
jgi:outer membrane protein OmpA-like peptidoglycan-associated protein